MADDTDILIEFCKQHWAEAKQAEDQRDALSNIILGISAALIALIAQKNLAKDTLPLALLLLILGVYGAIASEKLYERHQLHSIRASVCREKIDELHPNAQLLIMREKVFKKHNPKFPRLLKIRLHYL
jgi:uncharacterized membrane protein YeaQ/YmgE (transglycosylase-associated protein family)